MTERFTLLTELGRGGMGVVWKARDEETGQIVALKLLREAYSEDPEYLARFERELELAKRIDSINVVKVLGFGVRQKVPYLALEYIDGPSLHDALVAHGPYTWSEARALLVQIAQGLADANAAGVIHRDVKPSNVLIGPDGVAKLTDFGIARGLDLTRFTATSTILGTPAYLAPEGPKDARSDLYSLGVIGYELLTGAVPFKGTSYQEVIVEHIRTAPDLARLPAEARPIIGWLLAKTPAERPERSSALLPVLYGVIPAPAAPTAPTAAQPLAARPVIGTPATAESTPPPAADRSSAIRLSRSEHTPSAIAAPGTAHGSRPAAARRSSQQVVVGLGAAGLVACLAVALAIISAQVPPKATANLSTDAPPARTAAFPISSTYLTNGYSTPEAALTVYGLSLPPPYSRVYHGDCAVHPTPGERASGYCSTYQFSGAEDSASGRVYELASTAFPSLWVLLVQRDGSWYVAGFSSTAPAAAATDSPPTATIGFFANPTHLTNGYSTPEAAMTVYSLSLPAPYSRVYHGDCAAHTTVTERASGYCSKYQSLSAHNSPSGRIYELTSTVFPSLWVFLVQGDGAWYVAGSASTSMVAPW